MMLQTKRILGGYEAGKARMITEQIVMIPLLLILPISSFLIIRKHAKTIGSENF